MSFSPAGGTDVVTLAVALVLEIVFVRIVII